MSDFKVSKLPTHDDLSQRNRHNVTSGNGGGGGYMLEARVAKIEAHIEHVREDLRGLRGDIRVVWGAIFFCTLGLAGLMAHGFEWL